MTLHDFPGNAPRERRRSMAEAALEVLLEQYRAPGDEILALDYGDPLCLECLRDPGIAEHVQRHHEQTPRVIFLSDFLVDEDAPRYRPFYCSNCPDSLTPSEEIR